MPAATIACTLAGTAREVLQDGLTITHQLGERDTARVRLRRLRPNLWDAITLTINGTARFGGLVSRVREGGNPTGVNYYSDVDAIGWELYLDRVLASGKTYAVNSTLKSIVSDLTTTYLAGYGISLDAGMANGPAMQAQTYDRRSLADIFRELAAAANWTYRITPAKVLTWESAGATAAAWSVTDAVSNCVDDVVVDRDGTDYANKVWVVAGDASTPIVVSASDATEIAAHGLVEIFVTAPNVSDEGAASSLAAAFLTIKKSAGTLVSLTTTQHGTLPGQALSITLTPRGLSTASYLVQSVTDRCIAGRRMRYDVKASSLLRALAQWQDTFRSWSGSSSAAYSALLAAGPSGITVYPVGGDRIASVESAVPTWAEARNAVYVTINGTTFAGRLAVLHVHARAESAGVGVTPRLWNVTTGAAAATGTKTTSTTWQTQTIAVTLAGGDNVYRLEVLPDAANEAVYGQGYLEIH